MKRWSVVLLPLLAWAAFGRADLLSGEPPDERLGAPAEAAGGPWSLQAEPPSAQTERYSDDLAAIKRELAGLRSEVELLRESLDIYLGSVVEQLKEENAMLRDEIRRLHEAESGEDAGVYPWAAHDWEGAEELLAEPEAVGPWPEGEPQPVEPGEFGYSVVQEWGRTPEQAKALGEDVSSLKGLICVVPGNSRDEDLIALGRWFRAEFGHYDNINIEVFDDAQSAHQYAEARTPAPDHRVLTVSKYRDSARDVILLIRGDHVTAIPWQESEELTTYD